jgi:hypothetical protein
VPYVTRDTVFGGPRRQHGYGDWTGGKRLLDARVKIPAWSFHDLRRTFATGLANLGEPPHVIEEILNHRGGHKGGIAAVYNRSRYVNETRIAMERWSDGANTSLGLWIAPGYQQRAIECAGLRARAVVVHRGSELFRPLPRKAVPNVRGGTVCQQPCPPGAVRPRYKDASSLWQRLRERRDYVTCRPRRVSTGIRY